MRETSSIKTARKGAKDSSIRHGALLEIQQLFQIVGIFANVHRFSLSLMFLMLIDVYWCWLMFMDADWCLWMLIDVYGCWLRLIGVLWFQCMLIDALWFWLMLIDSGRFQLMLIADAVTSCSNTRRYLHTSEHRSWGKIHAAGRVGGGSRSRTRTSMHNQEEKNAMKDSLFEFSVCEKC